MPGSPIPPGGSTILADWRRRYRVCSDERPCNGDQPVAGGSSDDECSSDDKGSAKAVTVRVGVNGFGRIGRNFLRAVIESGADIDLVAVNDVTSADIHAQLLRYDSTHGRIGVPVNVDGSH